MKYKSKRKEAGKFGLFAGGGALAGWGTKALLGAKAVGVLGGATGVSFGAAAALPFIAAGALVAGTAYGIKRVIED